MPRLRLTRSPLRRRRCSRGAWLEPLEDRRLLAASAFANIDISKRVGNESEGAITMDRTTPGRVFALSNTDTGTTGMFAARSTNGGQTWTGGYIADGKDDLPAACCDPSAAFDSFGNLFISYINSDQDRVEVMMSTDGGVTFEQAASFRGDVDQPTLTVGPGSVWVTVDRANKVVIAGAAVTGLGKVDPFTDLAVVPGSAGGAFGDVAVGPDGQVAVTYQRGPSGHSKVLLNIDPDGLGPQPFGKATGVTATRVGLFDNVPAQNSRGIDAEVGLAYDRSQGPFRGRLYLVYTDAAPNSVANTDVFLRYSDDGGGTWSNPARVNDDTGLASQILPRIAIDHSTGDVALSWYDTRDDPGNSVATLPPPTTTGQAAVASKAKRSRSVSRIAARTSKPVAKGRKTSRRAADGHEPDRDHEPRETGGLGNSLGSILPADHVNDDVTVYAAVASPSELGVTVSANARVGAGLSNASDSDNNIDLGDYTGLDFNGGTLLPVWADNANSASQNPDGDRTGFDLVTARVDAAALTGGQLALGGLTGGSGPVATFTSKNYTTARRTGRFTFKVTYATSAGVDADTLDGNDIRLTGPNGFAANADFMRAKPRRGGQLVTATYGYGPPANHWASDQRGVYTIALAPDQVKDAAGTAAASGLLGNFVVDS